MFVQRFCCYYLINLDFFLIRYEYKKVTSFLMVNITYLYSFFVLLITCALFYFFFNSKSSKDDLNNKILLKNLLEGLELELPDELKSLDNSSTDTQKLS